MAVYDILPDTNLKGVDVRDTLNANGGSVGDTFTSFFTSGANINMWSKYKPVVSTDLFHSLDEWKGLNGFKGAYKGDNGDCGLTIPTRATIAEFRTILESGTAMWSYTPPTGGQSQPMRVGDFRGYNPKAVNPIGAIDSDGYSQNGDYNVEGNVTFNIEVSTGMVNNLEYGDIEINDVPLTQFYLGVYAIKGSSYKYKTNTVPIGSDYNFSVDLPLTTGEWKVFPFLCNTKQTGTETKGTYLSANMHPKTFTIKSTNDKVEFIIFGSWNSSMTKVQDITVTVKNNTSAAVTLKEIGVSLFGSQGTTSNNVGSPATIYYGGNKENTLTVPANSIKETTIGEFGTITLGDDSYGRYYLYASGKDGDTLYSDTHDVEELMPEE